MALLNKNIINQVDIVLSILFQMQYLLIILLQLSNDTRLYNQSLLQTISFLNTPYMEDKTTQSRSLQ